MQCSLRSAVVGREVAIGIFGAVVVVQSPAQVRVGCGVTWGGLWWVGSAAGEKDVGMVIADGAATGTDGMASASGAIIKTYSLGWRSAAKHDKQPFINRHREEARWRWSP